MGHSLEGERPLPETFSKMTKEEESQRRYIHPPSQSLTLSQYWVGKKAHPPLMPLARKLRISDKGKACTRRMKECPQMNA